MRNEHLENPEKSLVFNVDGSFDRDLFLAHKLNDYVSLPRQFYDQGSGSTDIMPFDKLPHVLRCSLYAVFCQFIRNRPRTFSFSPQRKDFFLEREQSASSRAMLYCMPGESANDIKLLRAVMPVFG